MKSKHKSQKQRHSLSPNSQLISFDKSGIKSGQKKIRIKCSEENKTDYTISDLDLEIADYNNRLFGNYHI